MGVVGAVLCRERRHLLLQLRNALAAVRQALQFIAQRLVRGRKLFGENTVLARDVVNTLQAFLHVVQSCRVYFDAVDVLL